MKTTGLAILATLALSGACLAQEVGDRVVVDTEQLNVRPGPSTQGEPVGRLSRGAVLVVAERNGDWVRLFDPLRRGYPEGWVRSDFLRDLGNATGQPGAPAAAWREAPVVARPLYPALPDPLDVDADFDCRERYADAGFSGCEIDVDLAITVPSLYAPFIADTIDIACEATIRYEDASGWTRRETESETTNVWMVSGIGSGSLTIDFDFPHYGDPVVSAKVEDLSCEPE